MGMAAREWVYCGGRPDDDTIKARLANLQVELSDLVAQTAILLTKVQEVGVVSGMQFTPTWSELFDVGVERQLQRMEEIRKARADA